MTPLALSVTELPAPAVAASLAVIPVVAGGGRVGGGGHQRARHLGAIRPVFGGLSGKGEHSLF